MVKRSDLRNVKKIYCLNNITLDNKVIFTNGLFYILSKPFYAKGNDGKEHYLETSWNNSFSTF